MAICIVVAAVVCHYYGVPDRMILLVAGYMLSYLLLEVFWVKKSVVRAWVLIGASSLFGFFLLSYLFNLSLLLFIPWSVLLFVILFVNYIWAKHYTAKSKERIAQWAAENGWQLLEFEHQFDTGPFGGVHWRAQMYFEFVICDQQGKRHTGWAHFDHSLIGGGRFEVKWIENSGQPLNRTGGKPIWKA
jgi:hypothetical protein